MWQEHNQSNVQPQLRRQLAGSGVYEHDDRSREGQYSDDYLRTGAIRMYEPVFSEHLKGKGHISSLYHLSHVGPPLYRFCFRFQNKVELRFLFTLVKRRLRLRTEAFSRLLDFPVQGTKMFSTLSYFTSSPRFVGLLYSHANGTKLVETQLRDEMCSPLG